MIRTFCLNFALKKSKILANGTAPVYLRFTIDGSRLEVTTRRYISPALWSNKAQKMKGTHEDARIFNHYLKTLEQQVYEAHRQLIESKLPITVQALKDRLFGEEKPVETKFLVPIFREHNRRVAALVGKEYAAGTLERYKTSLKHTIDFMKWHYKTGDIDVTKIDHEFISAYEFYLRTEKNCCNNTAVKYLKNFKKIIRLCISNGWLDKDSQTAPGFIPYYNEPMGLFYLTSVPHVTTTYTSTQQGTGRTYSNKVIYGVDDASVHMVTNDAVVNISSDGVAISDIKKYVVLIPQSYPGVPSLGYTGAAETVGTMNVYTALGTNKVGAHWIVGTPDGYPLGKTAIRISFTVTPNSNPTQHYLYVKTFYATSDEPPI